VLTWNFGTMSSFLWVAAAVGTAAGAMCQQPGVSVAAVAMARGLNANLLRTWVRHAERSKTPIAIRPTARGEEIASTESFVPVTLPSSQAGGVIRIKVGRRGRRVIIEWPASAAHECALPLRELVR
jgi:transposase